MDSVSKDDKFKKLKSKIENENFKSNFSIFESSSIRDEVHLKSAIKFLSRKIMSEKELKNKLRIKFGNLDFDRVIYKLRNMGFLNDNNLSKFKYESMSKRKLYSNSKIKSYLLVNNLPVDNIEFESDEEERALILLKKKYKIKTEKNKNRAFRLLFSYGYSSSIIRICIGKYFNEHS